MNKSFWVSKSVDLSASNIQVFRDFFEENGFKLKPQGKTFAEVHCANCPILAPPLECPFTVHVDDMAGIDFNCMTCLIYRGKFTGGYLMLPHTRFNPSNDDDTCLKFIIFRGDVLHYITDLKSGTREVLLLQFERNLFDHP